MSRLQDKTGSHDSIWKRKVWILFIVVTTILIMNNQREGKYFTSYFRILLHVTANNSVLNNEETWINVSTALSETPITPSLTPLVFQPMPINIASEDLLQTVQGIGPHLAKQIISARNLFGCLSSPVDLTKVKGIGERKAQYFNSNQSFSYECHSSGH